MPHLFSNGAACEARWSGDPRGLTWRAATIEAVHPSSSSGGGGAASLGTDARAAKVAALRCLSAEHDDDYSITLERLALRHRALLDFLEWIAWSTEYKHFDTDGDTSNDLDVYELREACAEWIADTDRLQRAHRRPPLDTGGDPDDAGFAVAVSAALCALVDGGDGGGGASVARTMSAVRRYVRVFGDWVEWIPACGLELLPRGGGYGAALDEYAIERAARTYVGLGRDAVRAGVSGRGGSIRGGGGRGGAAEGLHYSVRYDDGDVDRYIPASSVRPLGAATVRGRHGPRDDEVRAMERSRAATYAAGGGTAGMREGRRTRPDVAGSVRFGDTFGGQLVGGGAGTSRRTRMGATAGDTAFVARHAHFDDDEERRTMRSGGDPLATLLAQTLGGSVGDGGGALSSLDPVSLALATALAAIIGGGNGGGGGGLTLESSRFATSAATQMQRGLTTPRAGDAPPRLGTAHADAYAYALGEPVEVQPLVADGSVSVSGWLAGVVSKARLDGTYDVALDRAIGQPWDEVERGLRPAQMRRPAGRGARATVGNPAGGGGSTVSFSSPAVRRAAAASGGRGGGGSGSNASQPPKLRVALLDPFPMQTKRVQAAARQAANAEASLDFSAKFARGGGGSGAELNPSSKRGRAALARKHKAAAAVSLALVSSARAATAKQKQDAAVAATVATAAALEASPRFTVAMVSASDVKGKSGTRADLLLSRDNFDVLVVGCGCGARSRVVTAAEKGLGALGLDAIRRFVSNGGGYVGVGGGAALAATDHARGGLGLVAADIESVPAQTRRGCAKAQADSAAARDEEWAAAASDAATRGGSSGDPAASRATVALKPGATSVIASSKSGGGAVRVGAAPSSKSSSRGATKSSSAAMTHAPLSSSSSKVSSSSSSASSKTGGASSAKAAAAAAAAATVSTTAPVAKLASSSAIAKTLAAEGRDAETLLFAIEATAELGRSLLGVAGASSASSSGGEIDGILALHTLGLCCAGAILRERGNVLTPQFRVVARFSGEMHWVAPSTAVAHAAASGGALIVPRNSGAPVGKGAQESAAQRSIAVRTIRALVDGGDDAEYDIRTLRQLVAELGAFIDYVSGDDDDDDVGEDRRRRGGGAGRSPGVVRDGSVAKEELRRVLEEWIDERNRWDSGSIERAILRVFRCDANAIDDGAEDEDEEERSGSGAGRSVSVAFLRSCERDLEDFLAWIAESAARWRAFDRRGDGS